MADKFISLLFGLFGLAALATGIYLCTTLVITSGIAHIVIGCFCGLLAWANLAESKKSTNPS